MLNDLKFVQGAVARKDYVPALTHFRIADGRIYGFNGRLGISTPTDLDVLACPKAVPFVKAIERIPDGKEVVLNVTTAGKLSIKAGPFRAYVDCHPNDASVPVVAPAGDRVELGGEILPVLRRLSPFMGIDASRPWAMGILLDGQSAYATNNIVLVEHWMPFYFPARMCIPAEAVKELLRIGEEPMAAQIEANSVTFHFETGAWLKTQLFSTEWPDLGRVLNRPHNAKPIPDGFFDAVQRLDAFTEKDNRLHLRGGLLATSEHEGEGASYELPGLEGVGCHFLGQMAKLADVALEIDFAMWPSPCLFFGDQLRGAIVGMRINDAV